MRMPTVPGLVACAAAFLGIQAATLLRPTAAAAQGSTLHACYVPRSGTVYRIKTGNTPPACTKPTHVEFSWEQQPVAAPPAGPRAMARVLADGTLDPRSHGFVSAARMADGHYCLTPGAGLSPATHLALAVRVDPDVVATPVWNEELDWDKIGLCAPGQYGVSVWTPQGPAVNAEFVLLIP